MSKCNQMSEQKLIRNMELFEQTQGQNIHEHGVSVYEYAKKICSGNFEGMKIPDWFQDNFFTIVNNIVSYETLKRYCIFHDCGKPFCHEIDENGKVHFPNHADVSAKFYGEAFPEDIKGKWLTQHDMSLHTGSAKYIEDLCANTEDKSLLLTLIISAFAEVHSNAAMFGGIESTSFKIKWKKINQRAKQIFKALDMEDVGAKFYSYVVIRKDMEPAHRYVQACHAVMEHPNHTGAQHPSIICVEVRSETKLKSTISKLIDAGIQFKLFREGAGVHEGEITAICSEPIRFDCPKREFFRRYQLAS